MRISYSSLKTYQTCPLQYKYKYIDKLPEKKRPELIFGKFIHKVLFLVLNHKQALPPNQKALQKAKNLLKQDWPKEDLGKQEKNFRLKGELILEQFFQSFNPKAQEILSAEEKFAVPLEDHLLSGIIDRIDKLPGDILEVVDYKTGRPSSQEGVHQNQQLTFYYHAASARFPKFKEIRLSLHFLESDLKISSQRGKADILTLKSTIDDVSGKITKKQFPPKNGPLCRFCDYNEICPVFKQKAVLEKVEEELNWENLTQMNMF